MGFLKRYATVTSTSILTLQLLIPLIGGDSLIGWQGAFQTGPTTGLSLEIAETILDSRSSLACASDCVKRRLAALPCLAFGFNHLDRTCNIYKEGTVNYVPAPGSPVTVFEASGILHTVDVGGLLFSIYESVASVSFFEARAHCKEFGGYLLEIRSLYVYDAIGIVIQGQTEGRHIGANDIEVEGHWVHDRDGTSVDPSIWHWYGQEGSFASPDEDCIVIFPQHLRFYDTSCYRKFPFLCQKDVAFKL